MLEFNIEPHVGIGPIKLGVPRDEIRTVLFTLGFPLKATRDRLDYFGNSGIQIEVGEDDNCHFIGIWSRTTYSVTYHGTNVFDIPADQLFKAIAECDSSGDHVFESAEYLFPNQIITLWDADEQYDRLGGETRVIWAQIGLGNGDYLKAIKKIKDRKTK